MERDLVVGAVCVIALFSRAIIGKVSLGMLLAPSGSGLPMETILGELYNFRILRPRLISSSVGAFAAHNKQSLSIATSRQFVVPQCGACCFISRLGCMRYSTTHMRFFLQWRLNSFILL